jgi:hypothetical protein
VSRYDLTVRELEEHLAEQLSLLEASADAFDQGAKAEAKRMAASLRILLHDTARSLSLLGQLGRKAICFFDSAFDFDPNSRVPYSGLITMVGFPPPPRYQAPLDELPSGFREKPFDQWWSAPIFVDQNRREITRKKLVLTIADQDGGAHVDPSLDATYADLVKRNSLGILGGDGETWGPVSGAERAAIRQITHEVLKTLKPGYRKALPPDVGMLLGGMTLTWSDTPPEKPRVEFGRKVGRNERCPCGSGRKFKHCHGQH